LELVEGAPDLEWAVGQEAGVVHLAEARLVRPPRDPDQLAKGQQFASLLFGRAAQVARAHVP
jgi:hypothetical protein